VTGKKRKKNGRRKIRREGGEIKKRNRKKKEKVKEGSANVGEKKEKGSVNVEGGERHRERKEALCTQRPLLCTQ